MTTETLYKKLEIYPKTIYCGKNHVWTMEGNIAAIMRNKKCLTPKCSFNFKKMKFIY